MIWGGEGLFSWSYNNEDDHQPIDMISVGLLCLLILYSGAKVRSSEGFTLK